MIFSPAIRALLFALIGAGLLGGCGYRPLYGDSSGGVGVAETLSSISIAEADTRVGQIIRNDLISGMRPGNGGVPDRYSLTLMPEVKSADMIAKPQPATTRQAVHLVVSYELVEHKSGAVVSHGKTFSQASFDIVRQPFADQQAKDDATARAAHEVSADIRTRLAAYFASRQ